MRPMPPKELGKHESSWTAMMPAPELIQWVKDIFLTPDSKLFNQDHYHLYDYMDGTIQFLWSSGGFVRQTRHVIGQAEELVFRMGGFQKIRAEQQFIQWFGFVPDYVITLDGYYCSEATDIEFCALVEHELYHIGHKKDFFGQPCFSKDTGKPVLNMRGHDVEEFVGIVERYGTGDVEGALNRMVRAAQQKPSIGKSDIAHACGTCLRLVA
jgi:hypothetical protein